MCDPCYMRLTGRSNPRTRPQNIMMGLAGKEDYNPETSLHARVERFTDCARWAWSFVCEHYSTNEKMVVIVNDGVYILSWSKAGPQIVVLNYNIILSFLSFFLGGRGGGRGRV